MEYLDDFYQFGELELGLAIESFIMHLQPLTDREYFLETGKKNQT
jgi:hypothetical protein